MKFYVTLLLLCVLLTTTLTAQPVRTIHVDARQVKGKLNTQFKACVGAGRANEGLRADWQQQLAVTREACGFQYIRMHGLLTDDMAVYREDAKGNPEYNFQYVDVLYDYILSIGMKPFVELGFMPQGLASGPQTIFWWRGNVTPPRDYNKWAGLIKALTQHFTERYGAEEVKTWYFEVWNEPNLSGFWSGSQEEYFKLYEYSVKAIKGVNSAYRVGGPATAGAAWVPEMINFCHQHNLPIDFVSTHAYGVHQGYLDEFGTSGTVLDANPNSVSGDVRHSREQIAQSPLPKLELHYTEWSASYTPSDPIHDSYHEAAYILQKIKESGNAAQSMSYWVFTDIFEEAGPRFTPFHGGFGLLNYQGIRKPAFHAYAMMNKLSEQELQNSDAASWACTNGRGNDVQVLLWDYTYTHPGDSVHNQSFYIRDLPAKEKGKVKVQIDGIAAGRYQLEIYQVGYKVNDPYTAYLEMKRPNQLSRAQVDVLHQQSSGIPVTRQTIKVGSAGSWTHEMTIRENDVFLVRLVRQ